MVRAARRWDRAAHGGDGGSAGCGKPGRARYRWSMIDRYTLPEMGRVWSEAHKYELWCQVETLVL